MKYDWMDAYCLSKTGAEKEYKIEWDAVRYMVGDKMFVLTGCDKEGAPLITLKADPATGQMLRQQYKDIVPGYYMNKQHWNSVYVQGDVPDDVLRRMIDESYALVLGGLSAKKRREVLGDAPSV